ncbi:hypothetical protein ACFQ3S_03975 [Mucilaginibacter terrae]|uniref:GH12 family glycosyl hydrolase domain-containing protein n=1 Tax=Mucilaginibacter terrae TaxID=1955052 RepID=UPI00362AE7D0
MKKIISKIFVLLAVIALVSCKKSDKQEETISQTNLATTKESPKSVSALEDTQICGNGQGYYLDANNKLNNNIWAAGTSGAGSQCMWYQAATGKWGVNAGHTSGTGQNIKGYPSIARGWLWYNSSGSIFVNNGDPLLPTQLNDIKTLRSSWNVTVPANGEKYNTAYDIWLDPSKNPNYRAQYEVMIWINYKGPGYNGTDFKPIGSLVASNVSISGHVWNIYNGNNGSNNVLTFRRTTNTNSVSNLDIKSLLYYGHNNGYLNQTYYVLGIQAGWEIIAGGAFTTNSYSTLIEKY